MLVGDRLEDAVPVRSSVLLKKGELALFRGKKRQATHMSRRPQVGDGVAFTSDIVGEDVDEIVIRKFSGKVRVDLDALRSKRRRSDQCRRKAQSRRTLSRSCSSIAIRRLWNHSNESSVMRKNQKRV